jgi:hypothetical protein
MALLVTPNSLAISPKESPTLRRRSTAFGSLTRHDLGLFPQKPAERKATQTKSVLQPTISAMQELDQPGIS